MIVFTSITLNYLPKAKILAKTLKQYHPDWEFHLLISDKVPEDKQAIYDYELSQDYFDLIFWAKDLPIENINGWLFKHTVVELCTAVKGIYLQKLADDGHTRVIYIDPDIAVFNSLEPLNDILDSQGIILAPHMLEPSFDAQMIMNNEILSAMRHGIFNLGFLAINTEQKDGRRFVDWWAHRLFHYCYADYDKGIFTDQKWCDHAPAFFDGLHVLRDPGYDVASWNLEHRELSIDLNGQIMVNDIYPLRFYHFTGYDSGAGPNIMAILTADGKRQVAKELWNWYAAELHENGHETLGKQACFYSTYDNGVKIENEMRYMYRDVPQLKEIFTDPYNTNNGKGGYLTWWHKDRPKPRSEKKKALVQKVVKEKIVTVEASPLEKAQTQAFQELLSNEKLTPDEEFVPFLDASVDASDTLIKLIAFYLPQFHPIPENDEWWGKGFTEWRNVTRAVPQFPGHYQPHLPGELGFYDLRIKDVHMRQIELAKQYGLYGFAYHHYWFAGRRLLEMPVDRFLASKDMDFPFCLVWANENWTRRWDGLENDVLIAQNHSPESDIAFIKDLAPYMRDERYIRINGRPLLIVYRTDILPEAEATAERWREYAIKNGLGNPYLVAAQTFGFTDPRQIGYDAAVQFPPHNQWHNQDLMIQEKTQLSNPDFNSYIFDYEKMIEQQERSTNTEPYPVFKTVFPSWDSEPRKPGRGTIYHGAKPSLYKRWLQAVAQWTVRHHEKDERFVFINAWNEWAEGAHLEPDQRFGYANLQATKEVVSNFLKSTKVNQSSNKQNRSSIVKPKIYNDAEWLTIMKRSINETFIDGVSYPKFPDKDLQVRFTGSSYETVLEEASEFYIYLKDIASLHGKLIEKNTKVHDFGCGWGRFLRFFMKDVNKENIYGSDIMPLAIETCKECGFDVNLNLTNTGEPLPYSDNFFDVQIAYSVFTHLPEEVHLHWMKELARTTSPGGIVVVTLEPKFFLDRIKHSDAEPENIFLQGLAKFAPDIDQFIENFNKGEFIYLPTGGGDNLTADIYGEAIVPLPFIEKHWSEYFEIIEYRDYPNAIWKQAKLAVKRKAQRS